MATAIAQDGVPKLRDDQSVVSYFFSSPLMWLTGIPFLVGAWMMRVSDEFDRERSEELARERCDEFDREHDG